MRKCLFWLFLTAFMIGLAYLLSDLTELDIKIAGAIAGVAGVLLFLMFDIRSRNKHSDILYELRRKHLPHGKKDPECPPSKPSKKN